MGRNFIGFFFIQYPRFPSILFLRLHLREGYISPLILEEKQTNNSGDIFQEKGLVRIHSNIKDKC